MVLFLSNSCLMAKRDSRRARSSPAKSCLRARKRRRYPERARRAVEDIIQMRRRAIKSVAGTCYLYIGTNIEDRGFGFGFGFVVDFGGECRIVIFPLLPAFEFCVFACLPAPCPPPSLRPLFRHHDPITMGKILTSSTGMRGINHG